MKISTQDSTQIEWMRFPLIVGVVFIHSLFFIYRQHYMQSIDELSAESILAIFQFLFSDVLPRIAVPSFYFISGFLFFTNVDSFSFDDYTRKMRSRLFSMLIPYLIWNLIAVSYLLGLYWNHGIPLPDNVLSWLSIFWKYSNEVTGETSSFPLNGPLYFLRNLLIVNMLTPILFFLLKKIKFWFIVIMGGVFLGGLPFGWGLVDSTTVFFFSLGAYLSISGKSITVSFRKVEKLNYFISLILLISTTYYGSFQTSIGRFLLPFFLLSGVISFWNICSHIQKENNSERIKLLSKCTFFIYAAHTLIPFAVFDDCMVTLYQESNLFLKWAIWLITPLVKILACIAIYVFMRRFTPMTLNVLTGSRS